MEHEITTLATEVRETLNSNKGLWARRWTDTKALSPFTSLDLHWLNREASGYKTPLNNHKIYEPSQLRRRSSSQGSSLARPWSDPPPTPTGPEPTSLRTPGSDDLSISVRTLLLSTPPDDSVHRTWPWPNHGALSLPLPSLPSPVAEPSVPRNDDIPNDSGLRHFEEWVSYTIVII